MSRLDAAEAALERVQRNLERYRASVLKAAVEGRLVPTEAELAEAEGRDYEPAEVLLERILTERRRRWEEAELAKLRAKGKEPKDDKWKAKYKEPVAPSFDPQHTLPPGWHWASFDQVYDIIAGVGIPKRIQGVDGLPIPVFKVGEISRAWQSGQRFLKNSHNTLDEEGAALLTRSLVPAGTIVFAKIGAALALNRRAITALPSVVDNNVMGLFPPHGGIDQGYAFLHSCTVDMGRLSKATAIPSIRKSEVQQLLIPVPPVAEQARISEELERLLSLADAHVCAVLKERTQIKRLRAATLQWAFEGKLVDQDTSDEPASVLLERIRAEREAAGASKKKTAKRKRTKKAAKKS